MCNRETRVRGVKGVRERETRGGKGKGERERETGERE